MKFLLHFVIYGFNIEIGKDVSKMNKAVILYVLNSGEMSLFAHVFKRK